MKQLSESLPAGSKPRTLAPIEPGQALLLLAEIIADAEEIGADTIARKVDAIIRGAIATKGVEIIEPAPGQIQRIVFALNERTVLSAASATLLAAIRQLAMQSRDCNDFAEVRKLLREQILMLNDLIDESEEQEAEIYEWASGQ